MSFFPARRISLGSILELLEIVFTAWTYCERIKGFHLQHEVTDRDRYNRCLSALKNIEYVRRKFSELANFGRITDRYRELIQLKESYEKADLKG